MDTIIEIYADKIIEPVDPMRTDMDQEKINDLASSIKQRGLIQPITVRQIGFHEMDDRCSSGAENHNESQCPFLQYEVVAGHRRFKACAIAGIVKIPCIIKELTDQEVFSIRAHENLFRDDINPVDEAIYIGKLIGDDDSKISELAKQLNRSIAWVQDRLDILDYPDYFLPAVKNSKIKLGVAKCLAAIQDDRYRKMFFDQAVNTGMAVWQADYYLRQYEAGVFKNSEDIQPPDESTDKPQPVIIRQKCVRCGGMAESPNLSNVFIHLQCPAE